jgi:uncharacterized protein (DUF1501 family)
MTNTTLLSQLVNMQLTSAAMADAQVGTTGYKALVCIFLNGAIDGYQVLTPFGTTAGDTEYGYYATSRTNMSLRRDDPANPGNNFGTAGQADPALYGRLQPILDSNTGKTFGVHPRFVHLRNLYNNGRATFVANVGSLIQPFANKTAFDAAPPSSKPIGLFSHPDLQRHWQTATPESRNQVKGWGGKMAELLTDVNMPAPARYFSAISLLGANIWQTGGNRNPAVLPYAVAAQSLQNGNINIGGSVLLGGYATTTAEYNSLPNTGKVFTDLQNSPANDLMTSTYLDLLEKSILGNRLDARNAAESFQAAIGGVTLPSGGGILDFPTNGLGAQLATVARAIKARATLGQDPGRQIFMVQVGGWDHHANLLQNQNTMIPGIDNGLKAFHDFLEAEGMLNQVTTFTISDFGRTISSNGIGTDHAWGNNMIVMGGALNRGAVPTGNRIWGTYPQVRLGTNQPRDTSTRGTYIPSTATDAYHAELAHWLGIPSSTAVGSHMRTVLPNVNTFWSGPGSSSIGFMNNSV